MIGSKLKLRDYNIIFIREENYIRMKELIKNNLVSLCWGKENEDAYNIKDVIEEFMNRLEKKKKKQKYGFIGEFVYYLYILDNSNIIKPISLFFNQEERSFKKGFDLVGYDGKDIWYSEVKSGNAEKKDIDVFNLERLSTACKDINEKLDPNNRNKNYWETAKSNLIKIISKNDSTRKSILELLNKEEKNEKNENINNIIATSVIFDNSERQLTEEKVKKKINKLRKNNKEVTLVCIRKKTIEKVLDILMEVSYELK